MLNRQLRQILIKVSVLLIPFIGLYIYIEYNIRNVEDSYKFKKTNIEQQLDSIEILVLGSSHSLYGINPSILTGKGYNCSNVAQSLYYDYSLLMKYLPKMRNLKCVIVSASYFSLWFDLFDFPDSWRIYFYYHIFNIDNSHIRFYDFKSISYAAVYPKDSLIKMLFHGFKSKKPYSLCKNGWFKQNMNKKENVNDFTGKLRVKDHESFMKRTYLSENIKYLNEIVGNIKKRNIECVLITLPVSKYYSLYINHDIQRINIGVFEQLSKTFNIKYLNYFNDSRFNSNDFGDADHLNYLGANKFSFILNQDIKIKSIQ